MNINQVYMMLSPLNERLLIQQLKEIRANLPLDIYIKIKTILDKCLVAHMIYYQEIDQILALLECANSPHPHVAEQEEEKRASRTQAPSEQTQQKSHLEDSAHFYALFYQMSRSGLDKTLRHWSNKCKKQKPNLSSKYRSNR